MIIFKLQKYPAQAASGREMDVTMRLCLICNWKTVGFYFIKTHLSLSPVYSHLSVALFIWSTEPLATLWRHLGVGWRTQINGNIKHGY